MKINLITPAKKHSRNGNRTTAERWAGFLRQQGHEAAIHTDYDGSPCDLMIALHAWRSAEAVRRFRASYPEGPLIVALAGTDVNTFLQSEPQTTLATMDAAQALVCLHDRIGEALPRRFLPKLHVIYQSAAVSAPPRKWLKRYFDICVVGHLREEKDPLRAARAARLLPATSRIRVTHLGKAHDPVWANAAEHEQRENPRYHWKGEVTAAAVQRTYARSRLMVLSSLQEGGANVISEALVAGVPVLASDIPGNTGLLGTTYPGLFAVGNEPELAALLNRAETDAGFLQALEQACADLRPRFLPARESAAWKALITKVISP